MPFWLPLSSSHAVRPAAKTTGAAKLGRGNGRKGLVGHGKGKKISTESAMGSAKTRQPTAAPVVKESPLPDKIPRSSGPRTDQSEPSNLGIIPAQPSGRPTLKDPTTKRATVGASVRFGATTVHHVQIAPGQHLYPTRLSHRTKSGLTYLNPPGDKGHPKVTVEFPAGKGSKLRRHRERQAAMERYWLRTEEEEAEWRAQATRIAEEESAEYRKEPASCPSHKETSAVGDGNEDPTLDTQKESHGVA